MKRIRVTYNYHSLLHDDYRKHEITMAVGDWESEDVLQEFNGFSHSIATWSEANFPMLKLLALLCTAQIFLIGDIIKKQERENIRCITDVEVIE